jgi:hypothetical protein
MTKTYKLCLLLRNIGIVVVAVSLLHIPTANGSPPVQDLPPDWVRQFGTSNAEQCFGAAADTLGNVYVSGFTTGSLGAPLDGAGDTFLRKFNSSGSTVWTQQFGTAASEISTGVSTDLLGNAYITGWTRGDLGGVNAGMDDAFLIKYDPLGNRLWTRQIGTSGVDQSNGVSADGLGNIYIAGTTDGSLAGTSAGGNDAFVAKYDAIGNLLWSRQLGTSGGEFGNSVSADGLGNVYVAGATTGSLMGVNAGNRDTFLTKYDALGNLLWTRQLGIGNHDETYSVSADNLGNIFVTGLTAGPLAGTYLGGSDAYLIKYDAAGNVVWTQQVATSSNDEGHGVSVDRIGGVYVAGYTQGTLGSVHVSGYDSFISHYDASGNLLWTHEMGTASTDLSFGVSANGLGNVFLSGYTEGSMVGTSAGDWDTFVAKFTEVPEPASTSIIALAGVMVPFLAGRQRRVAEKYSRGPLSKPTKSTRICLLIGYGR